MERIARKDGHATGMAGEYFVMEQLFRLGHTPALTLGNNKKIDILVRTKSQNDYAVSVKAIRGGGKWGVGKEDYSSEKKLIFVLLLYRKFDDPASRPDAFVMPSAIVQQNKHEWFHQYAIYYSHHKLKVDLEPYREAWHWFD